MTEKKLKSLNRSELLELLLIQTREAELLQKKLEQTEAMLAERNLQIQEAGDLAHAVLAVNRVVEAAQAAAQQYLDNIAAMEAEARIRCEKMISDARKEADMILGTALNVSDAGEILEDPYFEQLLHEE